MVSEQEAFDTWSRDQELKGPRHYHCSCHRESGSHEACCGHDGGRDPDCMLHGDGGNSGLDRAGEME